MSTEASDPPKPFRIGLLGHGTVGAAFETLLADRAEHVAAITGLRPQISGVLNARRAMIAIFAAASLPVTSSVGSASAYPSSCARLSASP